MINLPLLALRLVQIINVLMKQTFLLYFLVAFASLSLVVLNMPVVAQGQTKPVASASPTPSPKPSGSPKVSPSPAAETESSSSSATTQKLRERIEKIVEEKKDQIKGVLSEFDQKKRGTLGNVTRVSEESITVKTRKATEIIPLNDDVVLQKAGKTIKIGDVAVGDWAVVMGLIEDDTFQPKRILVSSTTLRPATAVVTLGTIETVNRTQLDIAPRSGDSSFPINTDSKTNYQDINGEEIERADIKADMQAIVIGYENDKNEKIARLVRVLTVINVE